MFAIIRTGGKQYRVQPGDLLKVEKLELELGASVQIQDVLYVGGDQPQVGTPLVKGAKVEAVVVQQDKHRKILVFHKKRRKGYRRMKGHRQPFTELFISSITGPNGQSAKADSKPHIIDPVVIAAKKAAYAQANKENQTKVASEKKAKAKPAAKKASPKKSAKPKVASKRGAKIAKQKAAKKTAKKQE